MALSWATTRITATKVRMEDRADGRSNYTIRRCCGTPQHGDRLQHHPLRLVSCVGLRDRAARAGAARVILWVLRGATTVAGFTTIASMVALFPAPRCWRSASSASTSGGCTRGSMGRPTYVIRERTDTDAHPEIAEDHATSGLLATEPPVTSQPRLD